jgi:predicted esterase
MARMIGGVAVVALLGCGSATAWRAPVDRGRLNARPHAPTLECTPGIHHLAVSAPREALLYVPSAARATWPLLVLLHGAGGAPDGILERLRPAADTHAVVLLAPASSAATWDGIRGTPGVDVAAIDEAMSAAFDRCAVGPRLAIGGFSDGASYALTIGLANGDLFSHVLAFSPCGTSPGITRRGRPRVFISHGREDNILPFEDCGQSLARVLRGAGYSVTFQAFAGRHTVPPGIANTAFGCLISDNCDPGKR